MSATRDRARRRPARSRLLLRALLGGAGVVAGLMALLALWGLLEPRLILDVEREDAVIPALPEAWEGARVALLADFQIGMWLDNEDMVGRALRRAVRERPALLLIAGDFVLADEDDLPETLAELEGLLAPLAGAGFPCFAVLGNHDWGIATDREVEAERPPGERIRTIARRLESVGIRVLRNEVVPVIQGAVGREAILWVVGVGASYPEQADVVRAFDGVPDGAPRLVLLHNPQAFDRFPAGSAPLAMAGHTHGGQFRLPFLPDWSWMSLVKKKEAHADGWIEDSYGAPGNRLYVNRGIGFSGLPMRVNAPPELTLFTLRGLDRSARKPGAPGPSS